MRLSKSVRLAMVSLASVLVVSNLQAEPLNLDLSFCNGYSCSKASSTLNVYDGYGFLQLTDTLKANNIQLYELGFKGRLAACDYVFRGECFWGWGDSGRYTENTLDADSDASFTKASLKSPRTRDFTVGVGYLFTLGDCFEIIPMGGLSYHFQRFGIHDVNTDGEEDDILNNLRYITRWQGPWAGVDLGLNFCGIGIRGGYEYHWCDWHAQWLLDGPNVFGVAFSDMRKSSHANGQVGFVDAHWEFCDCWNIGIGVKWERWKATNGSLRPKRIKIRSSSSSSNCGCSDSSRGNRRDSCSGSGSGSSSSSFSSSDTTSSSSQDYLSLDFSDVGFSSDESDKIKSATWDSFRITFDIGCKF